MKQRIKRALNALGVEVTSYENLQHLVAKAARNDQAGRDLEFLRTLPHADAPRLLANLGASRAQLRQDLFVLSELNFKREGFFVEFGATNGVDLSNTYLLEKAFGWTGILAEPANSWHSALHENRTAHIETRCVWAVSGELLPFNEVNVGSLSTIASFNAADEHAETRRLGRTYKVESISLNDLLEKFNAPKVVDYLSIDTEGSEFEILNNVDYDRYSFGVITCEHNYTPLRDRIHDLLVRKGYQRKYQELSGCDDWYVKG
ncbi:MAG: FkbM family methyltransferase [Vicinamibacterales bacterium]